VITIFFFSIGVLDPIAFGGVRAERCEGKRSGTRPPRALLRCTTGRGQAGQPGASKPGGLVVFLDFRRVFLGDTLKFRKSKINLKIDYRN